MLWAVILGLASLLVAFLMFKVGTEIFEDSKHFFIAVVVCLVLFMIIGVAFKLTLPGPEILDLNAFIL